MGKKVLFFGDVGIDDAIALIYAHLTEKIDVVGIVAEYGNASKEDTVRNVCYLIKRLGETNIIVMGGANRPMTGEEPVFSPDIHGPHGFGPITPGGEGPPLENFFQVITLIEKYANEVIIVNTGRMTSLATLYLLYSHVMKKVHSIYIMGGAFLVAGNVTPVSEANVNGDPVAANIVFKYAGEKVKLFPLNVTQRAIVTPEMVNYIQYKGKTDLIKPLLDFYFGCYKKKVPGLKGSPVHDALALMAVTDENLVTFYETPVLVNTGNNASKGQTIGDFSAAFPIKEFAGRPKIKVAIQLNEHLFFKDFMTVMTGELF